MADRDLEAAAATAWAEALGCDRQLLAGPGWHMVPGGAGLRDRSAVYMASVRAAVLVYCPGRLRPRAVGVLASTPPGHLFTAGTCATIAGVEEAQVLGPSWHGFTDAGHFTPAVPGGEARDRALAAARNLTVFFPEGRVHAVIRAAAEGGRARMQCQLSGRRSGPAVVACG